MPGGSFRPLLGELATPSAANCVVDELPRNAQLLCRQQDQAFTLLVRDFLNRPCVVSQDQLSVRFEPDNAGIRTIVATYEGTYRVEYFRKGEYRTPREFRVSVLVKGAEIKASPFRLIDVPTPSAEDAGHELLVTGCKR